MNDTKSSTGRREGTFRSVLLGLLAAAALFYYGVCVLFAHAGVSWLWIWPLLALFCLVRLVMIHFRVPVPRWLKITYRVALTGFILLFVIVEFQVIRGMYTKPEQGLDYIITLGAAVRNSTPTTPLVLRINTTAEYMQDNPDTIDIASGGQGKTEDISESECIYRELVNRGIPDSRIIREDKSTNTVENLQYSFALIPEGSRVGIVTNSFHICRALRTAELLGYEACGIPAVTYPILGLHYVVREFFALVQLEGQHFLQNVVH